MTDVGGASSHDKPEHHFRLPVFAVRRAGHEVNLLKMMAACKISA
jgi:hypothetical protein